jgi:ureidoacrylate peracid hydrolase
MRWTAANAYDRRPFGGTDSCASRARTPMAELPLPALFYGDGSRNDFLATKGHSMTAACEQLLTSLEQKVSPEHTALVVVDVQNDFVAEGGYFHQVGGDVSTIQKFTIPPLLRLIDKARDAGVLVVFIQAIYDDQYLSAPMRERDLRTNREMPKCQSGTWGADFFAVRPLLGEPVVIKHRYSGMINTGLDAVLRQCGIKSLLLTGVATDTCVEATARDAYFIDYYVTLVQDCCGALDEEDHRGALKRFSRDYGAVVTSSDVIDAWHQIHGEGSEATFAKLEDIFTKQP